MPQTALVEPWDYSAAVGVNVRARTECQKATSLMKDSGEFDCSGCLLTHLTFHLYFVIHYLALIRRHPSGALVLNGIKARGTFLSLFASLKKRERELAKIGEQRTSKKLDEQWKYCIN